MSICTELSDRMPDVALGRSAWTETEQRHLAECADCRAEWALVSGASRLGATLPATDPAIVSTVLLARLARERERTRARIGLWSAAGLAAAAAVIVALWTGAVGVLGRNGVGAGATPRVATTPVTPTPAPPGLGSTDSGPTAPTAPQPGAPPALAAAPTSVQRAELSVPELDDLPAEALDSILQVLDEPAARADAYELPGLGDSGDLELEQALTGLEG
jgi:hypothetical protein